MPSRPALCDDPATIDADWMQRALAAGGASDYPAIRDVVVEDLGSASNAFGRVLRCHLTTDGDLAADPRHRHRQAAARRPQGVPVREVDVDA